MGVAGEAEAVGDGRSADLGALESVAGPDPLITSMAATLIRAQDAGAGQLYAESAAAYLAAHLLSPPHSGPARSGALGPRQMDTVTAYMRAHLADRVGLDDLAREVALSRFHFLRLFSATTGQTPHQFLTGLRIETARRLLEAGDEPVGRIGLLCGFSTASHFTTVFREQIGLSGYCVASVLRRRRRPVPGRPSPGRRTVTGGQGPCPKRLLCLHAAGSDAYRLP